MAIKKEKTNFSHTYENTTGKFDVSLTIPNVHKANDFASNMQLLITLKVDLQKDNTGTSRQSALPAGYKFLPWPDAAWTDFKNRFVAQAQFWDNRFWLVLFESVRNDSTYTDIEKEISIIEDYTSSYSGKSGVTVYPRVVACRFRAEIAEPGNAHYKLNATYIVDNNNNPLPAAGASGYILRSNDSNIDSGDVYPEVSNYSMIAHEVGHRLGLPHIGVMTRNAACVTGWRYDSNANACYDGADPRYTNDIMGRGGNVDWRDAVPWRMAFKALTGLPITFYAVQTMPFKSISAHKGKDISRGSLEWMKFNRVF